MSDRSIKNSWLSNVKYWYCLKSSIHDPFITPRKETWQYLVRTNHDKSSVRSTLKWWDPLNSFNHTLSNKFENIKICVDFKNRLWISKCKNISLIKVEIIQYVPGYYTSFPKIYVWQELVILRTNRVKLDFTGILFIKIWWLWINLYNVT